MPTWQEQRSKTWLDGSTSTARPSLPLLLRHDVELRPVGLSPNQIHSAARLYRDGLSLARLGETFRVDDMTVRRYLLLAGVMMRSVNQRRR